MKSLRFVDVSGIGNSGKSAVADLLREVERVWVPPYWFEFDFIRVPNGLLDLRHRLLEDWSPIRSHYGIKAFIHTAEQVGIDPGLLNIFGLLKSTSQRYDRFFMGDFVRFSKEFANSFVTLRYTGVWPYDDLQLSPCWRFLRKIANKLGMRRALRRTVDVPSAEHFDMRATEYLIKLYNRYAAPGSMYVVLNNGLEPFNPIPGLDMIAGSRQIVVLRDPRDVYVSGLNHHKVSVEDRKLLPFDNDGLNKSFLATDNLVEFVARQRLFYNHLYRGSDPRVLRVRFEDLCTNYEKTVSKILLFCGIDPALHSSPRKYFVPEKSRGGVGLWRNYSRREDVGYIADQLPDLIYPE